MSADNWMECPQCRERFEQRKVEAREALEKNYGRVSLDDWKDEEARVERLEAQLLDETFREDYELGLNSKGFGFYVRYRGGCSVCGLNYQYSLDKEDIREK